MADPDRTFTREELARLLGKSSRTLRRWEERGFLVAQRWPSGRPFYTQSQVDALLKRSGPSAAPASPPPSSEPE